MSPCTWIDAGDDFGPIVVCGPKPRRRRCSACRELGDLLCDFPVADGKTCDKPLCRRCAVSVGPDLDHCPGHHQEDALPRNPTDQSKCRSCQAAVYWVVTANGKKMPVDAEPTGNGGFYLFQRPERGDVEAHLAAVHVKSSRPEDEAVIAGASRRGQNRYTSHFETCPQREQHRRTR